MKLQYITIVADYNEASMSILVAEFPDKKSVLKFIERAEKDGYEFVALLRGKVLSSSAEGIRMSYLSVGE